MTIPMQPMVQQGWQCPVCKTVHAPFVPSCPRCAPPLVTVQTGGTSSPPLLDEEGSEDDRARALANPAVDVDEPGHDLPDDDPRRDGMVAS